MLKDIKKNKKGFSLMEILVAIAIFSVIMLLVMQIFRMATEGQRNAIAAQNIQENIRFVLEIISKEIRTAKKAGAGDCPAGVSNGKVYKTNTGGIGDELYLKNYNNACVTYRLNGTNNDRLEIERYFVGSPGLAESGFITPDEIKVSNLQFNIVYGDVSVDQPMVVVSMDIKAVGKAIHEQSIKLQTAISSRYYE